VGGSSAASGGTSPDAATGTGGSQSFGDPFANHPAGCGCRTTRSSDTPAGSFLLALGLATSLVRRRRKSGHARANR
jgi:MYXO-CTERM domain-containing protein